ncbi:replication protein RepA4 [Salmonella enterica]|nr:replication protein RepA4 [Salmonella enterica]EDS1445443.1 replication protein RepA4 [Salmonella enterica subsp. enterica serovar Enteritidis]
MIMPLCVVGVVLYPQPGRISALADRHGYLRACRRA